MCLLAAKKQRRQAATAAYLQHGAVQSSARKVEFVELELPRHILEAGDVPGPVAENRHWQVEWGGKCTLRARVCASVCVCGGGEAGTAVIANAQVAELGSKPYGTKTSDSCSTRSRRRAAPQLPWTQASGTMTTGSPARSHATVSPSTEPGWFVEKALHARGRDELFHLRLSVKGQLPVIPVIRRTLQRRDKHVGPCLGSEAINDGQYHINVWHRRGAVKEKIVLSHSALESRSEGKAWRRKVVNRPGHSQ